MAAPTSSTEAPDDAAPTPERRPYVPPIPFDEGPVPLADGRQLGCAQFGDPDGDVVLWFHGTPGARKQLPPETPDVARTRGLRVIVVERPGTGLSTRHRYDQVRDFAPDLEQLADHLGIDRFAVAGMSGGGPFALAVAHHLPDRVVAAAVLGGLGPTRGPEQAPGYTRVLIPLSPVLQVVKDPLGDLLSGVLGLIAHSPLVPRAFDAYGLIAPRPDRPLLKRPEFRAMFIQDMSDALDDGMQACVYDLFLFSRDWGFRLADITVPVRFWHGDADLIVPFDHGRLQAELVPDSALVTVPDGGHFSGFETVPVVLDALSDLWPDRPHRVDPTSP